MANVNYEWKEDALKIYEFQQLGGRSLSFVAKNFNISKSKAYQYVIVGEFLAKNPDCDAEVFSDCLNQALKEKAEYYTLKGDEFIIVRLIEKSKNFYIVQPMNKESEFQEVAIRPHKIRPSFDWEIDLWKKRR